MLVQLALSQLWGAACLRGTAFTALRDRRAMRRLAVLSVLGSAPLAVLLNFAVCAVVAQDPNWPFDTPAPVLADMGGVPGVILQALLQVTANVAVVLSVWAGVVGGVLWLARQRPSYLAVWAAGGLAAAPSFYAQPVVLVVLPRVLLVLNGSSLNGAVYWFVQLVWAVAVAAFQVLTLRLATAADWRPVVVAGVLASPLTYYLLYVVTATVSNMANFVWFSAV